MSMIKQNDIPTYISLLKEREKSLWESYWRYYIPKEEKIEFTEGEHLGIKYIITKAKYPRQPAENFNVAVLISVPFSRNVHLYEGIINAFEKSVFGEKESEIIESLDYFELEIKGKTILFPYFPLLESYDEARRSAEKLIELYVDSLKNSRNNWFKGIAKKILSMEGMEPREIRKRIRWILRSSN